jgi:hypothetical protein
MKRMLLAALLLLALALPVGAQEPTAEPTPVVVAPVDDAPAPIEEADTPNRDALVNGAIVIVAIVALTVLLREAIVKLATSVPAAAFNIAVSGVYAGVGELERAANVTAETWDDELVRDLKSRIEALEAEIRIRRTLTPDVPLGGGS